MTLWFLVLCIHGQISLLLSNDWTMKGRKWWKTSHLFAFLNIKKFYKWWRSKSWNTQSVTYLVIQMTWRGKEVGVQPTQQLAKMMASWPIVRCWANFWCGSDCKIGRRKMTHQTHWCSAGSWSASSQCSCTCRSPAMMSSLSFHNSFPGPSQKKFKGT